MNRLVKNRKQVSLRAFISSRFLRNVTVVMSGTAVAQLLGYVLMPVIARLYSPSDFGLFGSFQAVATAIAAGVTLQYSQALLMPTEQDDAANLMAVSLLSVLSITVLCALLVLLFRDATLRLLRLDALSILHGYCPLPLRLPASIRRFRPGAYAVRYSRAPRFPRSSGQLSPSQSRRGRASPTRAAGWRCCYR